MYASSLHSRWSIFFSRKDSLFSQQWWRHGKFFSFSLFFFACFVVVIFYFFCIVVLNLVKFASKHAVSTFCSATGVIGSWKTVHNVLLAQRIGKKEKENNTQSSPPQNEKMRKEICLERLNCEENCEFQLMKEC